MTTIRLIIAESHLILRSGLRLLLESQSDFQVVGEASCTADILRLVGELSPNQLVLGASGPQPHQITLIQQLRHLAPALRVLALPSGAGSGFQDALLAAGANGCIDSTASPEELILAIRTIQNGNVIVRSRRRAPPATAQSTPKLLSGREREVLRGLALGYTNKEIAKDMKLSVKTVETHRARLMNKLKLRSRAELVAYQQSYAEGGVPVQPETHAGQSHWSKERIVPAGTNAISE